MTLKSEILLARLFAATFAVAIGAQAFACPPEARGKRGPPHLALAAFRPASEDVTAAAAVGSATYKVGDPVALKLTITNTGAQPAVLNFRDGQKYDFEIHSGASIHSNMVWKWSTGRMFTMMLSSTTLQPGKSLVYTETFDPKVKAADRKMHPLPAGPYTIVATLKSAPANHTSTTTFTVK